jgi:hypothetical protein
MHANQIPLARAFMSYSEGSCYTHNHKEQSKMSTTSILWVVDGWRYWDATNGNSYHLTRITHTGTRRSIVLDECVGNACTYINKADRGATGSRNRDEYHRGRYHHGTIEDITRKQWYHMLKSQSYAPVSQYTRKGSKVTNVTVQLINKLRRST